MKTLRVKQNRVQTTVRRRQYDGRRENCTACIHHRFSVTCTTAILVTRFVPNYATGIQSVIWMETTKYFHSIVYTNCHPSKEFLGGSLRSSIFFTSDVGRKTKYATRAG